MQPALLRGVAGKAEARLAEGWGGGSETRVLGGAAEGQKARWPAALKGICIWHDFGGHDFPAVIVHEEVVSPNWGSVARFYFKVDWGGLAIARVVVPPLSVYLSKYVCTTCKRSHCVAPIF